MSNDAFRDALARSINDATYYRYLDMVDDILAKPQMVKVKKFILANLNIKDRAAARYDTVALAERHGLDPETVAWALSADHEEARRER